MSKDITLFRVFMHFNNGRDVPSRCYFDTYEHAYAHLVKMRKHLKLDEYCFIREYNGYFEESY